MNSMLSDTLLILFISTTTALASEGLTWVFVYRTEKYKKLKNEVEKQSKKLEKKKENASEAIDKSAKKKLERYKREMLLQICRLRLLSIYLFYLSYFI